MTSFFSFFSTLCCSCCGQRQRRAYDVDYILDDRNQDLDSFEVTTMERSHDDELNDDDEILSFSSRDKSRRSSRASSSKNKRPSKSTRDKIQLQLHEIDQNESRIEEFRDSSVVSRVKHAIASSSSNPLSTQNNTRLSATNHIKDSENDIQQSLQQSSLSYQPISRSRYPNLPKEMVDMLNSHFPVIKSKSSSSIQNSRNACVESILNSVRHSWRKRRETQRISFLFESIAKRLFTSDERREMKTILMDLPPAVFGDDVAKQTSRVLINVSQDVRDEMLNRRQQLKVNLRRDVDALVASILPIIKQLEIQSLQKADEQSLGTNQNIEQWNDQQQEEQIDKMPGNAEGFGDFSTISNPSNDSNTTKRILKANADIPEEIIVIVECLIGLLKEIRPFDRFRIVISQLTLSKIVPIDNKLRDPILSDIFDEKEEIEQDLLLKE